jgi:hypothetical protein
MTAVIYFKDKRDFVIEMKNFAPRWLPLVPRFPQAKCAAERESAGEILSLTPQARSRRISRPPPRAAFLCTPALCASLLHRHRFRNCSNFGGL